MNGFIVTGCYDRKMDEKREGRIDAVLDRCGVKRSVF
jgi:hypothetical protein